MTQNKSSSAAALKIRKLLRMIHVPTVPGVHSRTHSRTIASLVEIHLRPGVDAQTIAQTLRGDVSSAHKHLHLLMQNCMITRQQVRTRTGYKMAHHITPAGAAVIEKLIAAL